MSARRKERVSGVVGRGKEPQEGGCYAPWENGPVFIGVFGVRSKRSRRSRGVLRVQINSGIWVVIHGPTAANISIEGYWLLRYYATPNPLVFKEIGRSKERGKGLWGRVLRYHGQSGRQGPSDGRAGRRPTPWRWPDGLRGGPPSVSNPEPSSAHPSRGCGLPGSPGKAPRSAHPSPWAARDPSPPARRRGNGPGPLPPTRPNGWPHRATWRAQIARKQGPWLYIPLYGGAQTIRTGP